MTDQIPPQQPQQQEEKKLLRIEILEKMSGLATAGFGLVAALAWNDAIKAIFDSYFPKNSSNITAQLLYAVILTIIIVLVTIRLGKLTDFAKKQLVRSRDKQKA